VVLVLIDTLRRDHLPVYGYGRNTSPRLGELAERGWTFEQHVAQASHTVPSTVSMMLSQYPSQHGFVMERPQHFTEHPPQFPDEMQFLAEVFQAHGYATGGFVGNPFLNRRTRFDQGFDRFVGSSGRGRLLTSKALEWLQGLREESQPFFLYLHYLDVHAPYDPPGKFRTLFPAAPDGKVVYQARHPAGISPADLQTTVAMYDGGIAYVDAQIGRVLDFLDDRSRRDQTVVLVTSDHGEEFLDHGGMGHGSTVYGELVRVPLILSFEPRFEPGRRIERLTDHLQVAPTLLQLAGIDPPGTFARDTLEGEAPRTFAESCEWRTVYAAGHNLVLNLNTGERQVFRWNENDHEAVEGTDVEPLLERALDEYLETGRLPTAAVPEPGPQWSEEELDLLRELGYAK